MHAIQLLYTDQPAGDLSAWSALHAVADVTYSVYLYIYGYDCYINIYIPKQYAMSQAERLRHLGVLQKQHLLALPSALPVRLHLRLPQQGRILFAGTPADYVSAASAS